MYKYIFLYAAVAVLVLSLSHSEASTLTEYAMAQEEQSSNQTQTVVMAQTPEEKANLERFDKLDFEAWNTRNWTLFREIHAPDVLVVDFSGNATRGGDQHVQWAMATMSDALEISAHPIKIAGAGNWTAVTSTLPGNVTMVTVAHWGDGRIAEEYLFMQNPILMNQAEPDQLGSVGVGVSVFFKDPAGRVFHTYSAYARGIDMLNVAYHYLDLVPKGRDEVGHAFSQFWVRRHDEYGDPRHINTEYYDVTKNL